ncbi:MAG: hypothetical protein U9Q99_00995 [Nanoarchaeota archaeon]|nr:hypothetical protein [Nanoarchaeota archaeon]
MIKIKNLVKLVLIPIVALTFGNCINKQEKLNRLIVPKYMDSTKTVCYNYIDLDLGKMDLEKNGFDATYVEDLNRDNVIDALENICGKLTAYDSTVWKNRGDKKYAFGPEDFLNLQHKLDSALNKQYGTSFKEAQQSLERHRIDNESLRIRKWLDAQD